MITADKLLKSHKLRNTAIRREILQLFIDKSVAISNQDIEEILNNPDRITVYRTLKKFEESGVIHKVYDNSNQSKFALCSGVCNHEEHHDGHIHFNCEKCGNTLCLDHFPIPKLPAPNGYKTSSTQILMKGICIDCN